MIFKTPLWAHQQKAFERFKDSPEAALFFQPGTGKTGTVINILRHKFNSEKRFLRTLIIGPPVVVRQWKEEFARHSSVDPDKIILLQGEGSKRLKMFQKHSVDADGQPAGCVFISNYEVLLHKQIFQELLSWAPEAVVWDESQRIKNPSAKRTKLAVQLSGIARFRYILTGTPVLQSPLDIFSQFQALDLGQSFGMNFFVFRAKFFRDANASMSRQNYFPAWKIRPGSLEEINRIIDAKSMSVLKKDALDLPPMVREVVKVEMIPSQRKMYEAMKKDLVAFMNDSACIATMALTKSLRLMQLASGYVKTEDGKETHIEGSPKAEALRDLLEEITPTGKVNIWAAFRENYAQIRRVCDSLGVQYVELHGEVSPKQREVNIDKFRNDPNVKVMIGHAASAGLGVNLVEAGYTIYFSKNFSLEHALQSESRNHRGGSREAGHEKITVIDIVAEGTIDELILKSLSNKEEVSLSVLRSYLNA